MKHLIPHFVLLSGMLLLFGCEDINQTWKNTHPNKTATQLRVFVRIEGAGDQFPDVKRWYKGRTPAIQPDTTRPDWFALTWTDLNIPPGGTYHIGGTFRQSQELEVDQCKLPRLAKEWETSCGASLRLTCVSPNDVALVVSNFLPEIPITVSALQWTVTPDRLDLDSLCWGNNALEALSWQDVTVTPFTLQPGQSFQFDVEESELPSNQYALIRSISGDSPPYDQHQDVAQALTNDVVQCPGDIPTLTEWGLIILCALLISVMTWVFLKRKKAWVTG